MGKKNNRTCIICGQDYRYCSACGEDAGKPTWYFIFDSENCHDIYEVCVAYRDKLITQKEAYEKMSVLDTSKLKDFAEVTQGQIKEILSYKDEIKQVEEQLPKMDYTKNKYKK